MTEAVPVLYVAYEPDAELEINEQGVVENHDELVNSGKTYDEICGMPREQVEAFGHDVIEPCDSLWDEQFEDIAVGDLWRVEELHGGEE